MDLEITEGLSMRLIKEEEGGFLISAEKRETAAEECVLSLFGRFLSSNSYNRQAIREVMQRAWRMGMDLLHRGCRQQHFPISVPNVLLAGLGF
jgi:hypothetical protein